jgi:hypothetical protein
MSMLHVIMLSVIMLSVIILIVVIVSVVAPLKGEIRKLRVEDTYLIGSLNQFALTSDKNTRPQPRPHSCSHPRSRFHSLHQGILTEGEGSVRLTFSLG